MMLTEHPFASTISLGGTMRLPMGRLLVVTVVLLAAVCTAEAQQPRQPTLGYLSNSDGHSVPDSAFLDTLQKLGYVNGKNIIIEARYSAGQSARFPEFVADLVQRKVDVIAAWSPTATAVAKEATNTIPIVGISMGSDPVALGWASSFARPGGNVTGITSGDVWLEAKRLQLLKEAIPHAERVAVLANRTNLHFHEQLEEADKAGQRLGLQVEPFAVGEPTDLRGAFADMTQRRTDALLVMSDGMLWALRREIVTLAADNRLPAMYWTSDYTEAGGLISYAESLVDIGGRAAVYVDKILRGAKPDDIPIEQPVKFELIVNQKAAKALGLIIPDKLLATVDKVID
jgi:putative tryptophan/tyrosine transport system substrate-binding protein